MDPGDECLAVLVATTFLRWLFRDSDLRPGTLKELMEVLLNLCSFRFDKIVVLRIRPVGRRIRSGVAAIAIALGCLGGGASTALADNPGSLVHLVADKHDDATVRMENEASPDISSDSARTVVVPALPRIIATTYLSQFDGTIWGSGNCGPTSLAMGLSALKIPADPMILRHYADVEMGFADPESGTTWESLAYAAKISGATIKSLYVGGSYRSWTVDELRTELDQGHPVLLLVRYWNLPDHGTSDYGGDHYIVAVGFDLAGNLVYDDPAFWFTSGNNRTINHDHLMKAWTNTAVGLVRTAMALVAA